MNAATPVIYEVALEVDPAIAVAYDTWLEGHMRRVLEQEGFESGHVFRSDEAVPDGWQRRVVHYHVRSAADLERYLEQAAPQLRAEGAERWGDRFRATRRILTPKSELATPSASRAGDTVTECPNCGSLNIEKFCAACGQDNRGSVYLPSRQSAFRPPESDTQGSPHEPTSGHRLGPRLSPRPRRLRPEACQ